MEYISLENINKIPKEIGVYKIYCRDKSGNLININRFTGIDNTGLLYIGKTSKQDLRKRFEQFYYSSLISGKTYNHTAALKYRKNKIIRDKLGEGHHLFFEYILSINPNLEEKNLLKDYFYKFGEYPPLNK